MKITRLFKLNEEGFGHHVIIPALVVVLVAAVGIRILTSSRAAPLSSCGYTACLPDGDIVTIGAAFPNDNIVGTMTVSSPNGTHLTALTQGFASLRDCPDTTLRACNYVKYSDTIVPFGTPTVGYNIVTPPLKLNDAKFTDLYSGCGNYVIGPGTYFGFKCDKGTLVQIGHFTPISPSVPANKIFIGEVTASACSVSQDSTDTTIKIRGVRQNDGVSQMGVVYGPNLNAGFNPTIISNSNWVSEVLENGQTAKVAVTRVTIPNSDQVGLWFSFNGQTNYWLNASAIPTNLVSCN